MPTEFNARSSKELLPLPTKQKVKEDLARMEALQKKPHKRYRKKMLMMK